VGRGELSEKQLIRRMAARTANHDTQMASGHIQSAISQFASIFQNPKMCTIFVSKENCHDCRANGMNEK
jgi:hypothetical protein